MAFDYEQLDPGIRNVVRILHGWGYDTTDSGDGVTKLAAGWSEDDARPYPHVTIAAAGPMLAYEADVLRGRLVACGLAVDAQGPDFSTISIQASYDPGNRSALIDIMGLNDKKLAAAQVVVAGTRAMARQPARADGAVAWAVVP